METKQTEILDCLVIGAGIAGISSAIYLSRSSLSFRIVDNGVPGGKLNNVHLLKNYPGISSISGPLLAKSLYDQIKANGINVEYADVRKVYKEGDVFKIETDVGTLSSKTLIVATGMSFSKETVLGERGYLGKGVSYCATCDGPFFKGKDVAVIGNGSRSEEEAMFLASICSNVIYIPIGYLFDNQEIKNTANIKVMEGFKPLKAIGETLLEGLEGTLNGEKMTLPVSALFPLMGQAPTLSFLSFNGLDLNNGFANVDTDFMTNIDGLYVAGDAVNKRLRQAVTAASDGAIAATSIISKIKTKK